MMRRARAARGWRLLAICGLCVTARSVRAQEYRDRALALVGGAFQYDLSGTGTTWFGGIRIDLPRRRYFVVEPGVLYAKYRPQGTAQYTSLLIPEVQLQLQTTSPRVRPYVGVGAGAVLSSGSLPAETDLSLSAAAGLRFRLNDKWGLRTELRVRTIDPFTGTAAEWTGGVSVRF